MDKTEQNPLRQAVLNTYHTIPNVKDGASEIVALIRHRGRVVGYRLSDGTNVTKQDGVARAKQGMIAGVGIGIRKGEEYLKALPDWHDGNNLLSLPSVSASEL